jgi:hypothetical protein
MLPKEVLRILQYFGQGTEFPEDWSEGKKNGAGNNGHPFGSALRGFNAGDQGTILDNNADTHTYVVALDHGGIEQAVCRIIQDPGDHTILARGTRVAVTYAYGPAMIQGILPFTGDVEDNENRINITGDSSAGGNDPLIAGKGDGNFRPKTAPRDLQSGDWAKVSEDGNAVAVLAGGVNVMKSGMAQVRTHKMDDLVEVICRNYRLMTEMGVSEIKNDHGVLSWSFKGGSDQLSEAGSDQENWTFRMDLGGTGDLFRFRITQADGQDLFELHVDPDGRWALYTADGLDQFVGEDQLEHTAGDRNIEVDGNEIKKVNSQQTRTVGGNRTTTIGGSDEQSIGNDCVRSIVRHRTDTVGGKHEEKVVGGTPALAKPGDVARDTTINGTWSIDIGNPTAGANIAALPSYKMQTWTGDIKQYILVKGNYDVQVTVGNIDIKTLLGTSNFDASIAVLLGNKYIAPVNPVLKGFVHNSAMSVHLTARIAPMPTKIALTQTLAALVGPPLFIVYAIPVVGPILFFLLAAPIWFAKLEAEVAMNTAHSAADSALFTALPTFLSKKVFTE